MVGGIFNLLTIKKRTMYYLSKHITAVGKVAFTILFFLFAIACQKEEIASNELQSADASIKSLNSVNITSTGMNFIAPKEIPSGWNTFKYMNKTGEPHFFLLIKIPEEKTLEDYKNQVTVPFNNLLEVLRGERDFNPETDAIASWFFTDAINSGGTGIIEAAGKAVTSIYLEPGNYIIECYVKLPNGKLHSVVGMLDQMTVTEEVTKEKEPKVDVSIDITAAGIQLNDEIKRPGLHTFSVDFIAEPEGVRPDVHLVRIIDETMANEEILKKWMNFFHFGEDMEGLMTPAPAGYTFLGGTQEVPQGARTYFQAVLTPGKYALVSEIDHNLGDNFYQEFTVE